jgi:hypothetical protein
MSASRRSDQLSLRRRPLSTRARVLRYPVRRLGMRASRLVSGVGFGSAADHPGSNLFCRSGRATSRRSPDPRRGRPARSARTDRRLRAFLEHRVQRLRKVRDHRRAELVTAVRVRQRHTEGGVLHTGGPWPTGCSPAGYAAPTHSRCPLSALFTSPSSNYEARHRHSDSYRTI